MSIKPKPYTRRKSREQWKQLIKDSKQSGQSTVAFCEDRNVSYQSFIKWRSIFRTEEKQTNNDFLDITPTEKNTSPSPTAQGWDIELALGDDIVLRLRKAT